MSYTEARWRLQFPVLWAWRKCWRIPTIFIYCNHRQLVLFIKCFFFSYSNFSWIAITALIDSSYSIASELEISCRNISIAVDIQLSATLVSLPVIFLSYVSLSDSSSFLNCISDKGVSNKWSPNTSVKVIYLVLHPLRNDLFRLSWVHFQWE